MDRTLLFERFIALRYLRGAQGREEGRRFLRFVTYVAVGGVAVGVAALLLALSIVRGFSQEIEAKIIGFGAHVQVESFRDAPLEDATDLTAGLAAMPDVVHVASVIQEFVLLRRSASDVDGASLWGTHELPGYLADHLIDGSGDLRPGESGRPPVILGSALARKLGAKVGDIVTAFSVRQGGSGKGMRVRQFEIRGLYETDLANFDEIYAFVPLEDARSLFAYGTNHVTRIDLTLADGRTADAVAGDIEAKYPFPVMARSIFEVYRSLFAWVRLQENIIPLVIAVIVIVAAFNIIGTLLMIILEKTREIGVLVGLGATRSSLQRTFLLLGLLVGGTGVAIGEALALVLALAQQRYEIIQLPAEAYFMQSAPISLHPLDFAVVALITLVLCGLSAYLPARFAARIQPIQAIHFR